MALRTMFHVNPVATVKARKGFPLTAAFAPVGSGVAISRREDWHDKTNPSATKTTSVKILFIWVENIGQVHQARKNQRNNSLNSLILPNCLVRLKITRFGFKFLIRQVLSRKN